MSLFRAARRPRRGLLAGHRCGRPPLALAGRLPDQHDENLARLLAPRADGVRPAMCEMILNDASLASAGPAGLRGEPAMCVKMILNHASLAAADPADLTDLTESGHA